VLLAAGIALLGGLLGASSYLLLERLGRRAFVPALLRGGGWAALAVLLANVSCPVPGTPARPLVLLDNSLSLAAAGGRWAEARRLADSLGEVRTFGDDRPAAADTVPTRGRSRLGPALQAAVASGRPVIVVTDGELEDARELPPDLLRRAEVRALPRAPVADIALVGVRGPARLTLGDTLALEVEVAAVGGAVADSVVVEAAAAGRALGRGTARLRGGTGRLVLRVPTRGLPAGALLVEVRRLGAADGDARTDRRLHLATLVPTPGIVLLAAPADWDARFLLQALRSVTELPVEGYVRLDGATWRSMRTLASVPEAAVRKAAAGADLLVTTGAAASEFPAAGRARWRWPGGEGPARATAGEWYVTAGGPSPLAGALLGAPLDSFPPLVRLAEAPVPAGAWIGLQAQLGRRGAERPVLVGVERAGRREVLTAGDGFWRWAFRGGSSEQAYRAIVGATVSWLLGARAPDGAPVRPVRAVVEQGRPVVFEWTGDAPPAAQPISFASGATTFTDTLRPGADGRAHEWLPPGVWRYRLPVGGEGVVAVEEYSGEFLPRAATVGDQPGPVTAAGAVRAARDWPWLLVLAVLCFAGEWYARRRLGLR